jgi:hypothetical protein
MRYPKNPKPYRAAEPVSQRELTNANDFFVINKHLFWRRGLRTPIPFGGRFQITCSMPSAAHWPLPVEGAQRLLASIAIVHGRSVCTSKYRPSGENMNGP